MNGDNDDHGKLKLGVHPLTASIHYFSIHLHMLVHSFSDNFFRRIDIIYFLDDSLDNSIDRDSDVHSSLFDGRRYIA